MKYSPYYTVRWFVHKSDTPEFHPQKTEIPRSKNQILHAQKIEIVHSNMEILYSKKSKLCTQKLQW